MSDTIDTTSWSEGYKAGLSDAKGGYSPQVTDESHWSRGYLDGYSEWSDERS